MSMKIFTYDLAQKYAAARQRSEKGLTEEQKIARRVALRELSGITKHPHIQAGKPWLSRFASEGGNISIQKIAQNIYRYMIQQRGRVLNCAQGGAVVVPEKEEPDAPVSFEYFERLYLQGKESRFRAYLGNLSFLLQKIGQRGLQKRVGELDRNDAIFSLQALKLINPSFLLYSAAQANYWEDIDLLVRRGGKLDDFSRLVDVSAPTKREWIQVYERAYWSHRIEENRRKLGLDVAAASNPKKKSKEKDSSPKKSSSSDYADPKYLR